MHDAVLPDATLRMTHSLICERSVIACMSNERAKKKS